MKIIKCIAFFWAGLLAATFNARANLITGNVDMGGSILLNADGVQGATSGTFDTGGTVKQDSTGSYANSGGDPVTWAGGSLSFAVGNQAISPLWSFSGGGEAFSFDLASIVSYTVSGNDLTGTLVGYGTLEGSGVQNYTPTAGSFTLIITDSSGGYSGDADFGFQASDTAALPTGGQISSAPDGGLTAALLGCSVVALRVVRRKI